MSRYPLRTALVFVLALSALSAGVFAVQQALYRKPPVIDLTPSAPAPAGPAPVAVSRSGHRAATSSGVPVLSPAWVARVARRTGLPAVALTAYARAELMAPAGCGIGWTTLAGIGWVESHQGTLGGRTLLADGHSSSPIRGPALDGGPGLAAIAATPASTRLHGDPRWDHAVGPMQFLPSTWQTWGADGDGDGVRDPDDLDDAALAAAGYLCADGRDLAGAEGWTAAVLSYNHDRSYLDAVHAAAVSYADRA